MGKIRITTLIIIFLAVSAVGAWAVLLVPDKPKADPGTPLAKAAKVKAQKGTAAHHPDYIGEKIIYDVRLGNVYLGKAQFNYVANTRINGRPLILMTLETSLARFLDTEKIYGDPDTLLPFKIERNILKWFTRENITEDYNQKDFTVTITKTAGNKQNTQVIKKTSPINNPILLPHYVRRIPDLKIGTVFTANFPNREFKISLVSLENIRVPAGTFIAYHFQSTPKQIDIWITADQRRIPIKIQGSGPYGYLMAMKKYSTPELLSLSKTQKK